MYIDVPESIGKTHHYRRECPSEHHREPCEEDFKNMLVKDSAIDKIQDIVRENVEKTLAKIRFDC